LEIIITPCLACSRVFGNSPEILVGPMPVSLRKSRTTPVCSSPSPLGRFARPLHEHDTTVHPPSISIRSQVVSAGKLQVSPLNDTMSLFGRQSGLAFVRLPSVPDMINAFNTSSQQVPPCFPCRHPKAHFLIPAGTPWTCSSVIASVPPCKSSVPFHHLIMLSPVLYGGCACSPLHPRTPLERFPSCLHNHSSTTNPSLPAAHPQSALLP
jgi:hypothetical protein